MPFVAGQKVRAAELNAELADIADAPFDVPFGHAGCAAGFQTISATNGVYVTLASQLLKNGMTFAGNGLVVPKSGLYQITARGYFTGGTVHVGTWAATVNSTAIPLANSAETIGTGTLWKQDSSDYQGWATGHRQLNAGDTIRLWMQSAASTYGTTGYNGSYIEVRYVSP